MLRRNLKNLGLAVTLLLVLSQGLSLVHATGHVLEPGDSNCQVCMLQHHFHSVTLDTKPRATGFTAGSATCLPENHSYLSGSPANKAIRAPPRHPRS